MVVAAARVAAGEVVVGALVPILVPVVGLVQVAAVLLLLLLEVGAALLLVVGAALLLVVGAALLLVVGAALLLLLVAVGAADHHYTPLVPEIWVHTRSREKDMVIFSAQPNSYTVAGGCRCTSDKEAFLYIRLRMTPQYSIDRSQRRKDYMYCTQQLGHHACCTCEVNGFVQIPYMRAVHMLHAHLPIAF